MTARRRRWPGRMLALAALVGAGLAVAGVVQSGPLVTFDEDAPAEQTGLSVHLP
jgi:hypothetical protein